MKRLYLSFSDESWKALSVFLEAEYPGCRPGTAARLYLQKAAESGKEQQKAAESGKKRQKAATPTPNPTPIVQDSPDSARARKNININIRSDKNTDPTDPVRSKREIAALLNSLFWGDAKLSSGVTAADFADRICNAYPQLDIAAELHKASGWLADNPKKRKKRLGPFLMGWLNRSTTSLTERPGPIPTPSQPSGFGSAPEKPPGPQPGDILTDKNGRKYRLLENGDRDYEIKTAAQWAKEIGLDSGPSWLAHVIQGDKS